MRKIFEFPLRKNIYTSQFIYISLRITYSENGGLETLINIFFSSRGGRAIEILPVRQPYPTAIFLLLLEMTGKAIVKDFSLDCSASCYK